MLYVKKYASCNKKKFLKIGVIKTNYCSEYNLDKYCIN